MIGPIVGMVILVNTGNPPYPPGDSALTIRAIVYPPIDLRAGCPSAGVGGSSYRPPPRLN